MIKLGIARDDIEVHVMGIYNQTTMLIGDRGKIAAPSVNLFYTRIAIVICITLRSYCWWERLPGGGTLSGNQYQAIYLYDVLKISCRNSCL